MIKMFDYKTDRLHGLDHLRAIAILLVMFFHYGKGIPSWLEPIKQIGWTGVDLFFVLSGYLIGFQLLKEIKDTNSLSLRSFYLKRFFRIIPAFLVVLILYYALGNLRDGSGMPDLWRFLSFTQNLGLDAQNQNSFSHAWSLCIEEQFYLILPFALLIIFNLKLRKGTPYIILALILLGFALRYTIWQEHVQPFVESGNRRGKIVSFFEQIYYPTYNRMDGLLLGVGIAAIFNYKPKLKASLTKYGNLMLLFGFGLFLIAYPICENLMSYKTAIYGFPLVALAYAVILIAALSPSCILYRFKSKLSFIIATLSYAIYLTHKLVFHLTKMWIEKTGVEWLSEWTFWLCILIALLAAFILHLSVEKPFLRLRKSLFDRQVKGNNETKGELILNWIRNKAITRR